MTGDVLWYGMIYIAHFAWRDGRQKERMLRVSIELWHLGRCSYYPLIIFGVLVWFMCIIFSLYSHFHSV